MDFVEIQYEPCLIDFASLKIHPTAILTNKNAKKNISHMQNFYFSFRQISIDT